MLDGVEMLHILEKLFLRINNDVQHGPFNLTFSFLNYCISLLFTATKWHWYFQAKAPPAPTKQPDGFIFSTFPPVLPFV